MSADFVTVLWKEWKEIVLERSSGGTGSYRALLLIAALGIFMPFRLGPDKFFNVTGLLMPTFLSAIAVTAVIADSFAGERERHTLETLLASRLSDHAILLGKIAACIAYGWALALACILVGAITVNVVNWHGEIFLFHDPASWLILLLGAPLVGGVVATAGVLVSLRAATVRGAQQTLSIAIVVLVMGIGFGSSLLPAEVKTWFTRILFTWSQTSLVMAGLGVLLALNLLLLLAGMARFQRAKLVLD